MCKMVFRIYFPRPLCLDCYTLGVCIGAGPAEELPAGHLLLDEVLRLYCAGRPYLAHFLLLLAALLVAALSNKVVWQPLQPTQRLCVILGLLFALVGNLVCLDWGANAIV